MATPNPYFDANRAARGDSLCTRCLARMDPKSVVKGSFIVELGLWLMLFIWLPLVLLGIGYTLWRIFSRHKACPECGAAEYVPADSERARRLLSQP